MITSRAWARPSSSDDKRCTPPGRVASAPRRHGLLPQQERAPGVEVEAVPPDVPADGDVELLGKRHRHLRGRGPRRDERHAHPRRLERSEEHTSELQSRLHLVCRLLLEKKKMSLVLRLHNRL